MATRDQLRRMLDRRPFEPFFVRLTGGRDFVVRHPELVSCGVNSRGMTIEDEDGSHQVEMLLVEVIEPTTSPARPNREGDVS
jgi:hypothetical protein